MTVRENIEKWVEALKSDKYKQAKETLCLGNTEDENDLSYCCLGVYGDLFDLFPAGEKVMYKQDWGVDEGAPEVYDTVWLHLDTVFPKLDKSQEYVFHRGSRVRSGLNLKDLLVSLNDEGFTFSEIADVIERCLEKKDKLEKMNA